MLIVFWDTFLIQFTVYMSSWGTCQIGLGSIWQPSDIDVQRTISERWVVRKNQTLIVVDTFCKDKRGACQRHQQNKLRKAFIQLCWVSSMRVPTVWPNRLEPLWTASASESAIAAVIAKLYYGPPSGRVSKGAWDRSEPMRASRYISDSTRKVDLDERSVSSI